MSFHDFLPLLIAIAVSVPLLIWGEYHRRRNEHLRPGFILHNYRRGDRR